MAKYKNHTTSKEAIAVVKQAKPWRTILTHFSIRMQMMPEVLPQYEELKIMLAFDHMRLPISDFEWAYKYQSIYQNLLGKDEEPKMIQKNQFKDRKKQWKSNYNI